MVIVRASGCVTRVFVVALRFEIFDRDLGLAVDRRLGDSEAETAVGDHPGAIFFDKPCGTSEMIGVRMRDDDRVDVLRFEVRLTQPILD